MVTKVKNVNDIVNLDSVNKVAIVNGGNGDIVDVIDENQKKAIIDSLKKLKLSSYDGEATAGWTFAIILSKDDGEVKLVFQGVNRIYTNDGHEYTIKNVDDNLKKICDSFIG